jgi:hypothetical protein
MCFACTALSNLTLQELLLERKDYEPLLNTPLRIYPSLISSSSASNTPSSSSPADTQSRQFWPFPALKLHLANELVRMETLAKEGQGKSQ